MKITISKEKIGYQISSQKQKFREFFLPVYMWPRSNLMSQKKIVKNLVTLSL